MAGFSSTGGGEGGRNWMGIGGGEAVDVYGRGEFSCDGEEAVSSGFAVEGRMVAFDFRRNNRRGMLGVSSDEGESVDERMLTLDFRLKMPREIVGIVSDVEEAVGELG